MEVTFLVLTLIVLLEKKTYISNLASGVLKIERLESQIVQ